MDNNYILFGLNGKEYQEKKAEMTRWLQEKTGQGKDPIDLDTQKRKLSIEEYAKLEYACFLILKGELKGFTIKGEEENIISEHTEEKHTKPETFRALDDGVMTEEEALKIENNYSPTREEAGRVELIDDTTRNIAHKKRHQMRNEKDDTDYLGLDWEHEPRGY